MIREIIFRGKRTDNYQTVEGFFARYEKRTYIIEMVNNIVVNWHEVIPETVGQYTGLNDKNGKRIFEGDILSFPDTGEDGFEYKEGYDFTNVAAVCWNNGRWELESYGNHYSGVMDDMELSCHYDFISIFCIGEVIGNIHDNPELLEVEG